ncbi:MAG TPA: DegT/DnrJ/EryC1/StrS family aminotransferase [Candidatus Dormibacteraeota bacterium]
MSKLYSRHRLDIGLRQFLYALSACFWAWNTQRLSARLVDEWSPSGHGIATRSVRSGFHLILDALDLKRGDEVLVSAITHPDMVRIIEAHGLVPVPVDLDIATLGPSLDVAERLVTGKTRAILVAHLFGGRFDTRATVAFAQRHHLAVWEDCAQAFAGPGDTGDPRADASMYSFGALKTGTALGGALIKVRDRSVLQRMRDQQRGWPVQSHRQYATTVLKFIAFSLVTRPVAYGALAWFHRTTGRDFDRLVNSAVRAFRPGRLLPQLMVQPSAPLLASMSFRLASFDGRRLRRRAESGAWLAAHLPAGVSSPGGDMEAHTHWLFPVLASEPEALIAACRLAGFDAARGASSVAPVAAPPDRPEAEPERARRIMQSLVFLPAYPELSPGTLARLADALDLAATPWQPFAARDRWRRA